MSRRIEIILEGENAKLGEVPASDIAKLFLGVESAIARASGHVLGRRVKATGRWGKVIEQAAHLRLVEYREGSIVHVLEVPEPLIDEASLQLGAASLGEQGVDLALAVLAEEEPGAVDVAEQWLLVADALAIGQRYEALRVESSNGTRVRSARMDGRTRQRLRVAVDKAKTTPIQPNRLRGTLFEADFERDTARLRTPLGEPVDVRFGPDLADDIYRVLRAPAEFEGEVAYDPETTHAVAIVVRTISPAEQLELGFDADEFWRSASVSQLAAEQHVTAVTDVADLYVRATDAEADAFLEALRH